MQLCTMLLQIAEQKDAAIRGLSNYMFMEAQRMAKVPCVPYACCSGGYLLPADSLTSASSDFQEGTSGSPADKFDG